MNYYKVLGINRNATIKEIKKAYHKLALKWHPDKNKNNIETANKKFREITEAYDTLSNETKRRNYDMFGKVDNNTININPDEIFKSFFGNQNIFQVFSNADNMFNINIGGFAHTNQPTETKTRTTFIKNGEVITKITTTKKFPDGTQNVSEQIIKNRVDASIRNKTPNRKKKKLIFE